MSLKLSCSIISRSKLISVKNKPFKSSIDLFWSNFDKSSALKISSTLPKKFSFEFSLELTKIVSRK